VADENRMEEEDREQLFNEIFVKKPQELPDSFSFQLNKLQSLT